jgi:hypothetical protein
VTAAPEVAIDLATDRRRAVGLASDIVALRVILARLALAVAESQDDVTSEDWMRNVAEECAEVVKNVGVSAGPEFDVAWFRDQTVYKINEILTGHSQAARMPS